MSAGPASASQPDVSTCDQEPIHIPGSIQPHGVLFCLEPRELTVLQVSRNSTDFLNLPLERIIRQPIGQLLGSEILNRLKGFAATESSPPRYLQRLDVQSAGRTHACHAVAHRNAGGIILELELIPDADERVLPDPYWPLEEFIASRPPGFGSRDLAAIAARVVRRVIGCDRVLVYEFDEQWNGSVIAEDRNDRLPSYLGLSFPASDIPKQARDMYRRNRIRLIADARYQPIRVEPPINPVTGEPLDLTFAVLRSVSPVHVEYMRNMGTMASMSFSIIREGQLWGLISCHHLEPLHASFQRRSVCDLVSQMLSLELAAFERSEEARHLLELQVIQASLLREMASRERFVEALIERSSDLLSMANAQGAAILFESERSLVGVTPTLGQVEQIVDWLEGQDDQDVVHTDSLARLLPAAGDWADAASGLLSISVSKIHRSYILWFRPEQVKTVTWGGEPQKATGGAAESGRLSPRKSFEAWKELVRMHSTPWRASEVSAATEFRNSIVGIVLRRAEELAQLTAELERSNKELEAFSYSVSHDLRAPLRHIAGYAELLGDEPNSHLGAKGLRFLDTIKESVEFAGKLVDNLLHFSRLGRNRLKVGTVNFDTVIRNAWMELEPDRHGRQIEFAVQPMPQIQADAVLMQVVVRNLLSNALKYSKHRPVAEIEVGSEQTDREFVFYVKDNGVGFDMQFVDKLFGVFQRLHRIEDFEGTGIGLANVRRIVERHGGRTWAEGEPEKGATFYFSLPLQGVSGAV